MFPGSHLQWECVVGYDRWGAAGKAAGVGLHLALGSGLQLSTIWRSRVSNSWCWVAHTDGDLGRQLECLNDMNKCRKLGFLELVNTREAFFRLFDRLRRERIIPA